jgi:pimeloyl-ACP methyl ester carboxylesterase
MKVRANGIAIEVEDSGVNASRPDATAVLLIMGLGMQLIAWPPAFIRSLVSAGHRVVRMDNRDVGLSQHLDELGKPSLMWASLRHKLGLAVHPPYSLTDMAHDAIGVLDSLGIRQAHVVGVSMGGMIGQRIAIAAPTRVLNLTSIMSSSGAPNLPGPRPDVMRALLSRPADRSEKGLVDQSVRLFKLIGSPAFPLEEKTIRDGALAAMRRSFHPVGTLRQMIAVVADGARAQALSRIALPTLVVHGREDPLVPYACGVDSARRITGAKLVGIAGMGHDLPPAVIDQILAALLPHLDSAKATV